MSRANCWRVDCQFGPVAESEEEWTDGEPLSAVAGRVVVAVLPCCAALIEGRRRGRVDGGGGHCGRGHGCECECEGADCQQPSGGSPSRLEHL